MAWPDVHNEHQNIICLFCVKCQCWMALADDDQAVKEVRFVPNDRQLAITKECLLHW